MFRRARNRVRRRWWLAGLGGAGILVIWLMPWRDGPAALELVALGADGRFDETVAIPRQWADTAGLVSGAVVRVPLVLAVRNVGGRTARPTHLELSVPTRYRLARSDGRPVTGELAPGAPLVRYGFEIPVSRVDPGRLPMLLPALDTLWLEPVIPSFYCMALTDSVPEFVPAPPAPIEALSRLRIFYSFAGADLEQRQTGLLTVQLDPALLRSETPAPPPIYPVAYGEPEAPRPPLGALRYVGHRRAYCGEPEDPMELLSTLWETPNGGRFIVLDHGGAPRKYLFDLNRDSIIELEMWDPDADGSFEARRPAQLPIPAFLLPPPPPPPLDVAWVSRLPEDRLALLDRYAEARSGPYRLREPRPDTAPRINRYRPLEIEGDTTGRATDVTRREPSYYGPQPPIVRRPQPGEERGGPPPAGARPEPTERLPGRPVPEPPAREGERAPTERPAPSGGNRPATPTPPPAEGPKLLGRPVDSLPPPRPRPDTTGARR